MFPRVGIGPAPTPLEIAQAIGFANVEPFGRVTRGIDLSSVGTTEIVPPRAGMRFIAWFTLGMVTASAGAAGTATVAITGAGGARGSGVFPTTLAVGDGTYNFEQQITEYPVFHSWDVNATGVGFIVQAPTTGTFICELIVWGFYYTP